MITVEHITKKFVRNKTKKKKKNFMQTMTSPLRQMTEK